jgi:hypothetical protein
VSLTVPLTARRRHRVVSHELFLSVGVNRSRVSVVRREHGPGQRRTA